MKASPIAAPSPAVPMPGAPTTPGAIGIELVGMTMRFGTLLALDDVSMRVHAGSFHALLGENGAGKSTLVKCLMGFYRPTAGGIVVEDRERDIPDPRAAHLLGLGMVYQHFTLAPSLTGAENLLISREEVPGIIDWTRERAAMERFLDGMPFRVPLDVPAAQLSAGEKQKLEILKQLYLGRRFLVLDEPTSVMTPAEADEVLGLIRDMTRAGALTVLMITHKFREVTAFADEVTVLRRGRKVGGGKVGTLGVREMTTLMVGEDGGSQPVDRAAGHDGAGTVKLSIRGLQATDRSGRQPIAIDALEVRGGEIVGVAGVSGNGQTELMELLTGQRAARAGEIRVDGEPFTATREQVRRHRIRCVPEEPLANACAATMSVGENLAFRDFDLDDAGRRLFWLAPGRMRARAQNLVARFGVKTAGLDSPIGSLSGGNVQRAVLARELTGGVSLLLVANPCFGLDFAAAADIRSQILSAREGGCAVLLISEDLDEIMALADRVVVMSEGRISYTAQRAEADLATIGRHMAGHGH
ncbi:MAG: ABC transporter ATP-binding protein [Burkholderiaceae bacterium]